MSDGPLFDLGVGGRVISLVSASFESCSELFLRDGR